MKKYTVWIVILVCVLFAALLFGVFYFRARRETDLKLLAQTGAQEAYDRFSAFLEKGEESDYWGGVAAFYAYERAYSLLTSREEASLDERILCSEVYGSLLLHPEESKARLAEVIDVLALLARTPSAVVPPFTLEALFTQLTQLLLSPHAQQRFDQAACELRSLLYLALLAFLTFVTQRDFASFLAHPLAAVLPLLVASLLEDTGLNDLQGRASALALLTLLYESDVGADVQKLVLERQDVLKCLVRVAEYVDVPILGEDVVCRQQREVYVVAHGYDP